MPTDVAFQVMWNRLIAVVEEQALALVRTAFSTSVREAGDLSAGVYDLEGRMLAQAVTGTPGHVNAMAESVKHFMREIGTETMVEGDVYITNDPWWGTGHLHDITVVTPAFYRGRHIGYFACTAHVVDVGGRGFGVDGESVFEEGLQIPIMRLARAGAFNGDLMALVRANVREPDQVAGDIYALASCNEVGIGRLAEMLDEFALSDLDTVAAFILENSHRATVERIAALTAGSVTNEMVVDGLDEPVRLAVRLDIARDHILADFAGTSGISRKGINVPLVYTQAYACYALKCAIAPEIPNNAASLAPFRVTAPVGSILNAERPAPVCLRHVMGHMVPDTILGALHKLMPGTVPAEGCGALCNFQLYLRPRRDGNAPPDARHAAILMFNCGGSGARPTLDGMSATAFPSGVMTMPVEATEQTGPIIIWRKELRPDSGGAGQFRGGLGQHMEIGAAEGHEFDFSAMFDRLEHPALGREGGLPGGRTSFRLDDGTPMRGKGRQAIPPERVAVLDLPGGAGYGDPQARDPALIRRDLARGYISPEAARRDYGFDPEET